MKKQMGNRFKCFVNEYSAHTCVSGLSGFLAPAVFGTIALLLFAACRQNRTNTPSDEIIATTTATGHDTENTVGNSDTGAAGNMAANAGNKVHYTRPEIPSVMTDPGQRAAYYAQHYWDDYSLNDTAFIRSDDTELLYADFIDALQHTAPEARSSALRAMMIHAESDSTAYTRFCALSEKYLYDPNSPMRNEDYYISVLEQMLASTRLTKTDKLRPADRLKQACKNRPGMTAPDFTYVTPTGAKGRMTEVKADYTLLFFYDPDCSNCRMYEKELAGNPAFVELQQTGRLHVLAVYTDENKEEWLQKAEQMPPGWIVGWNEQGDIYGKQLYEIRATPTMYLLDKQKKIILKDATLEQVIQYLPTNHSRRIRQSLINSR